MKTDDLIDRLSTGTKVAAGPSAKRWVAPLALAALACFAALIVTLGAPLTSVPAIGIAPYAMKLGFAVSIAVIGGLALYNAGLPGRGLGYGLIALTVPFVSVLALAMLEVATGAPDFPGETWVRCLTAITVLTPLTFIAAIVAMRRLAPTRLRLAGALSGILSSAVAASAYALWCPETTALFLLSWYATPILAAAAIGALLGPKLLRW